MPGRWYVRARLRPTNRAGSRFATNFFIRSTLEYLQTSGYPSSVDVPHARHQPCTSFIENSGPGQIIQLGLGWTFPLLINLIKSGWVGWKFTPKQNLHKQANAGGRMRSSGTESEQVLLTLAHKCISWSTLCEHNENTNTRIENCACTSSFKCKKANNMNPI